MTTYNVSVPNDKSSFFKEFLEIIGAKYTEEIIDLSGFELSEKQKQILLKENEISMEECIDAIEFHETLKEKYDL